MADRIFFGIVCCLSFLVPFLFSLRGVDLHHDGVVLKNAIDCANGKVLYRDSFTQYGCIPAWIAGICVWIFGEKLMAVQLAAALAGMVAYAFGYRIIAHFVHPLAAFFSALILLGTGYFYCLETLPWANLYANAFLMAGLWAWICYEERDKKSYLFLSGICTGLALYSKLPIGALMLIAHIYVILLGGRNRNGKKLLTEMGVLAGTQLLISMGILGYFSARGALADFWEQTVDNAQSFAFEGKNFWRELYDCLWNWDPWFDVSMLRFFACICLITFLIFTLQYLESGEKGGRLKIFLSLCGMIGWSEFYPVFDYRHIYWGLMVMIPVAVVALWVLVEKYLDNEKKKRSGKIVVVVVSFLFTIQLQANALMGSIEAVDYADYEPIVTELMKGIRIQKQEGIYMKDFEETIAGLRREYPDKEILNLSMQNYLSCYMDTISGEYYSLYGMTDISDMERKIRTEHPILFSDMSLEGGLYQGYEPFHTL